MTEKTKGEMFFNDEWKSFIKAAAEGNKAGMVLWLRELSPYQQSLAVPAVAQAFGLEISDTARALDIDMGDGAEDEDEEYSAKILPFKPVETPDAS